MACHRVGSSQGGRARCKPWHCAHVRQHSAERPHSAWRPASPLQLQSVHAPMKLIHGFVEVHPPPPWHCASSANGAQKVVHQHRLSTPNCAVQEDTLQGKSRRHDTSLRRTTSGSSSLSFHTDSTSTPFPHTQQHRQRLIHDK